LNTEYPNSDKAYSDFRVPPGVESPLAARVGFLQAKWLEHYVAYMLQYLGPDRKFSWEVVPADAPFGSTNVRSGQYFNIRSRLFEADVVALHGNRIRYISVTTSHDKNVCQGKLFEAMHRARQIGGGLASAAVVCLLERTPCTSIWMSTGKDENHQVFGCDELDLWEKGKVSLDFYNWLTK
jgi:hypothetical protein